MQIPVVKKMQTKLKCAKIQDIKKRATCTSILPAKMPITLAICCTTVCDH